MKKFILLVMVTMTMLVMSGCGGGSVEVVIPLEPVVRAPAITLNQLTQDRVYEFIDGRVSFFAPDYDIVSMTIAVFNESRGGELVTRTTAYPILPGVIEGTIPFNIDYIDYPNGKFTFSIFLTDKYGNTSNQIVGTFLVP